MKVIVFSILNIGAVVLAFSVGYLKGQDNGQMYRLGAEADGIAFRVQRDPESKEYLLGLIRENIEIYANYTAGDYRLYRRRPIPDSMIDNSFYRAARTYISEVDIGTYDEAKREVIENFGNDPERLQRKLREIENFYTFIDSIPSELRN